MMIVYPSVGDYAQAAFEYRMNVSSDIIRFKALINAYSQLETAWAMQQLEPYYTKQCVDTALLALSNAKIITPGQVAAVHHMWDIESPEAVVGFLYILTWHELGYELVYTHDDVYNLEQFKPKKKET